MRERSLQESVEVGGCCSRQGLICEHQGLEFDTGGYRKPVEGDVEGCDIAEPPLPTDISSLKQRSHFK